MVLAVFFIPVLLSSLVNTNRMSERLLGPGLDSFRSDYDAKFYLLIMFQLVSVEKALLVIGPLYMIGEFFYLSWMKLN